MQEVARARHLRRESTDAERLLWKLLRGRNLAGFKFRRQHEMLGFILDFYCPGARVAIEVDGGGHYSPQRLEYDAERTRLLNAHGVRVLRFTNTEVLIHPVAVGDAIWRVLSTNAP